MYALYYNLFWILKFPINCGNVVICAHKKKIGLLGKSME